MAYDFCVVVTSSFCCLYVLVVTDHAVRRSLHADVTLHLVAQWTLQQLREAIPTDHAYRYFIHDGDSIFSAQLDQHIGTLEATGAAPPQGLKPARYASGSWARSSGSVWTF